MIKIEKQCLLFTQRPLQPKQRSPVKKECVATNQFQGHLVASAKV
jgi:hypothetical protein